MTTDQATVIAILAAALALFVWERWRYDLVATAALIAVVAAGLVEPSQAFAGFGHPATVTVAAILVMTRGFANSGAVDIVTRPIAVLARQPMLHVAGLCALVACLSAFMNNVAALALLMPVAIQSSVRAGRSPSFVLMPLAFAAVLGGIVTLIGTPPNIILSSFRADAGPGPFALLDFAPVGLPVAVAGVLFLALAGWRLLGSAAGRIETDRIAAARAYQAEIRVAEDSRFVGKSLAELETVTADSDAVILGVVRGSRRFPPNRQWVVLREGDVLVVQAPTEELDRLLAGLGGEAMAADAEEAANDPSRREDAEARPRRADDPMVMEAVVHLRSPVIGRTAAELDLQRLHEVTLMGLSRRGRAMRSRLRDVRIEGGDVLLLQGEAAVLPKVVDQLGCMTLVGHERALGGRGRAWLGSTLFAAAVLTGGMGFLDLPVALVLGALLMVLTGLVPIRELYTSIDWPVIVLLGAMMPLGNAFASTGTTDLVAGGIVALAGDMPVFVIVALLIVVSMLLSDLLNNAATALIVGPVAIAVASALGRGPDMFLMAVAVGASCSFLTPVGHQNYTIVMGPGGYRFVDYARLGLPLEILVVIVATPLLVLVWS